MKPTDTPWTYEEEQELIDLRYKGIPIIQVAQLLNRTVDSCRKKHWLLMREPYTNPDKFREKINYLEEKGILETDE